ncbi:hypothetical protein BSKO_13267 [Bryopsis sp. KO-2023]|nr:hypothetical protein BSKO_13267 [Bryopsis sp. KO-2023]
MRGNTKKKKGLFGALYEDNWLEMGLSCLGQRPPIKRARCEKGSGSDGAQEVQQSTKKKRKSEEGGGETSTPVRKWRLKSTPDPPEMLPSGGGGSKKYKGVCFCKRINKYRSTLTLPSRSIFDSLPTQPARSLKGGALALGTYPTPEEAAKARDLAILALDIIDEENSRYDLTRASLLHFPDEKHPKESIDLMRQFIFAEETYIKVRSVAWCVHTVSFRRRRLGSYETSREAAMCYDKACLAVFGMDYKGSLNFNATAYEEGEVFCMYKFLVKKMGFQRLKSIVTSESEGVALSGFKMFCPIFRQGLTVRIGVYPTMRSAMRAYDLTRLAFRFLLSRKSNFPGTAYTQAEIDDFRHKTEVNFPDEVKEMLTVFSLIRPSASSIIDRAFKKVECKARNGVGCTWDFEPTKSDSENGARCAREEPTKSDSENGTDSTGPSDLSDGESSGESSEGPSVDSLQGGASPSRSPEGFEHLSVDFVSMPCAKDEPVEAAVGVAFSKVSECDGGDFEWGYRGGGVAKAEPLESRMGVIDVGSVRLREVDDRSVRLGEGASFDCEGVDVKQEDGGLKEEERSS